MSQYEASQGDVERAVRLLSDLHMMGVHRMRAGTLAEQLTGLAVCKVVHDAVFAILHHCQIDVDLLAWTLEVFASRVSQIVVPHFFEVEYLHGLDVIQRLFTDDGAGDGKLIPARLYESRKKPSLFRPSLAYPESQRICLTHPGWRSTTRLLAAYFEFANDLARRTPWDLHTQGTSYEEELKRFASGNFWIQDGSTSVARCMELGWPDHLGAEALVAVLAVLTHKAREGHLPESLAQVVNAGLLKHIPIDPYSGAPLVYRRGDDDFTLYSVGEDFVDDGGVRRDWDDEDGGDCVFWPVPPSIVPPPAEEGT